MTLFPHQITNDPISSYLLLHSYRPNHFSTCQLHNTRAMARRLVTEKHGKAYWTNMTTHSSRRALMAHGELTQIPLDPSYPVLTDVE